MGDGSSAQSPGKGPWEMSWEVGFPATALEELLLALIVRDLVHGASYDVEGADGIELEIDFSAGDELEGDAYHLVLSAEVHGPEDREFIHRLTQQMLDDTVDEAERLAAARTELGERGVDELEFRRVAEDDERWDLVVPDWLAPDGAEVPFGFRVFDARTGDLWPTDELLRAHGRIVAVPSADRLHLFGIPAPEGADPAADSLPIHPRGG